MLNSHLLSLGFSENWLFNMISRLGVGLVKGLRWVQTTSLWFVSLITCADIGSDARKEVVKKHDIHIKLKSYKLELLRELVNNL